MHLHAHPLIQVKRHLKTIHDKIFLKKRWKNLLVYQKCCNFAPAFNGNYKKLN